MAVKGKTWRSAGGSVPRVSVLRRAVIKVLVLASESVRGSGKDYRTLSEKGRSPTVREGVGNDER
jgi:hypothetical protein